MRDFVITSLQSWDSVFGGNAKDIAIALSVQHRVLYINPRMSNKKKSASQLRNIKENLWVLDSNAWLLPVNYLPDGSIFDTINKYNNRKIFQEVNKYTKKLVFKKIIHFCDNDIYRSFYAHEFMHADIHIYYRRDNLHPVGYWSRHIARLEPKIIVKSDLIMCNSAALAQYAIPYKRNSWIFDIGQGVDLSAYCADIPLVVPEDCKHLVHPIVGYIGALTDFRLDIELLYQLASERRDCTFLFIGKRENAFLNHPLCELPNVIFLGLKPMEQIPAYTKAIDVCLNPQIVNEVTIGNYPRKVDEYLAMGKPVVATRTQTMELFREHVYLCSTLEEYLKAINDALENDSLEIQRKRIAFAHTHSWAHCTEKIIKAIEKYENA